MVQNSISVMHGIAVMVYQNFVLCNSLAIIFKWQVKDVEMQNNANLRSFVGFFNHPNLLNELCAGK